MIHPFNVINWSCRSNINCSSAIHIPQQARSGPLIHKQWVIMAGHLYNRVMYQLRPLTVGIWDKKEQNRAAYYLTQKKHSYRRMYESFNFPRSKNCQIYIFYVSLQHSIFSSTRFIFPEIRNPNCTCI